MYKVNSVVKNGRVWYEILNKGNEKIVSTKSYGRARELTEILRKNKELEKILMTTE